MSRYGPQIQWTGKPHRVPLLSFHCFIIFYNCQPRYSLSELLPENPTVFLQYNMEEYQIRNISRNQQTNQGLFIIYGRGAECLRGALFWQVTNGGHIFLASCRWGHFLGHNIFKTHFLHVSQGGGQFILAGRLEGALIFGSVGKPKSPPAINNEQSLIKLNVQ